MLQRIWTGTNGPLRSILRWLLQLLVRQMNDYDVDSENVHGHFPWYGEKGLQNEKDVSWTFRHDSHCDSGALAELMGVTQAATTS